MEATDFEMPSPKRQRTESPTDAEHRNVPDDTSSIPLKPVAPITAEIEENNNILDALLQHVESETTPLHEVPQPDSVADSRAAIPNLNELLTTQVQVHDGESLIDNKSNASKAATMLDSSLELDASIKDVNGEADQQMPVVINNEQSAMAVDQSASRDAIPHTDIDKTIPVTPAGIELIDGIPPTEEEAPADEAAGPEWEVDSSPYESSSDSDSSDDSSSDNDSGGDEDADGDYAMLDPEEQARILMQGDAGSDDEGGPGKGKSTKSGLKTANEQFEDVPPIPDIAITEDMAIEELGVIEAVVENNVLIKAKVSGEYQVLESGSLLCFADRKAAGVIAETLGRVEQPLYTMRFQNEQDVTDKEMTRGKILFYVRTHSSFVFTQPLKAVKGSDASNIHDEEVGDEEMEFSDDEAEAEHKRQLKLKRQGRLGEGGRGRGVGRGRGGKGGRGGLASSYGMNGGVGSNDHVEMNYDEVEEREEGYNVLSRPNNLHEMMNAAQAGQSIPNHMPPPPAFKDRSQGRGRGGGNRDRGRRGGHDNFRGRGGNFSSPSHHNQPPPQHQSHPNAYQNTGFAPSFPPPPPPMLTPQNSSYPGSFITSPISPLPQQQFNFGNAFQQGTQYGNFPQPPPQQVHQQPQNMLFHPGLMQQFAQHQQQNQQQTAGYNGQWQPNQAAVADVQRQLEEMRKAAGQGGQHYQ